MNLLDSLLGTLGDGKVNRVLIGLHWTAVVVEIQGQRRCGLASTLHIDPHLHHEEPEVPRAGRLGEMSSSALAALAHSELPTVASVGAAAINALLPPQPDAWFEGNAEEIIGAHGEGRRVVMVGRFPFVRRLRSRVEELLVLERHPKQGEMPESAAPEVIPDAEVVAITGTTLINHTLEDLLKHCPSKALTILLGPSTPLSPVLFDYGVDLLCGSVVTDIDSVLRAVEQGAYFRQVHQAGVRLINMARPGFMEMDV